MATEVRLPQLGQTMEEGTIVNCMVKVGDEVKKGDVIFEIETDKATLEMESPAGGFVKHIVAELDQTLPVGEVLLVLGEKDEEVPQSFLDSLKAAAPAGPTVAAEPAKPKASPRAKKLAKDLGVDLAAVAGTGPAGKITEQDVKNAPAVLLAPSFLAKRGRGLRKNEAAGAEVKLGASIQLNKLQRITAQRMLKSKREIPCFYLTVKADVTDLVRLRTEMNETGPAPPRGGVKISYNDFIIRAVATGLEKFPIMTGQLAGDTIQLAEAINIGLAVSVPDGLIVPVIKDVNKKDVMRIARDRGELIEKAHNNKLLLTDLEGACITVSNLGAFGIESFIAIVIPGQCSILGIGQITDTCMPDNGDIAVRKLMNLTLSVDHKVANGTYAAQFLDFVRKLLEDTSNLV